MSSAAASICTSGKAVPRGVVCMCQRQRRQDSKARFDAKRPSNSARRYNARWASARKDYLAQNPRCAHDGCNAFASVVDHVIPHKGDMPLSGKRPIGPAYVCTITAARSSDWNVNENSAQALQVQGRMAHG
jgi:5-methylcytosine-specific restriction enzyme A